MSVMEKVKAAKVAYLKASDMKAAALCSTLLSAMQLKGKNAGNRESTEEEALKAGYTMLSDIEKTLDLVKGKVGREADVKQFEWELGIVSSFLPAKPAMLSEAQLLEEMTKLVAQYPELKGKSPGPMIGKLRELFGDVVDGALASKVFRTLG